MEMLKKKNSSESRAAKASSSSAEHHDSFRRTKSYFAKAFRNKTTMEKASPSSPTESPTTPTGTPPALPLTSPPIAPTNIPSPAINDSESTSPSSLECSVETPSTEFTAEQSGLSDELSCSSRSQTKIQNSIYEETSDCRPTGDKKLSLPVQRTSGRKLSAGERPTVRFTGLTDDRPNTNFLSATSAERPRSVTGTTYRSNDAISVDDSNDTSDDEVLEQAPRTRKGSLPSIYDPSSFDRVNQGATCKTFSALRTSTTKESPFTVKYVRVHGPEDGAYKNDSRPRGLIFMKNFEEFADSRYSFRKGSGEDYKNLLTLFQQMGYRKSQKYCESGFITKEKFLSDFKAFSKLDHNMYDSCIIILMSHGVRDKTFVCSDGEHVDLMDVYSMLNNTNCQHLRNKPKIFILQFCRPQGSQPKVPSPYLRRSSVVSCSLPESDWIDLKIKAAFSKVAEQLRSEILAALQEKSGNDPVLKTSTSSTENEHNDESVYNNPDASSTPNVTSDSPYAKCRRRSSITSEVWSSPGLFSASSTNPSSVFSFEHSQLLTDAAKLDASDDDVSTPDYSDMYSIFSTNAGGVAYRHPRKGSLLVQAICHVFSSHAYQDDIEELVRKVSKWMQQELAKDDPMAVTRNTVVERVNNGLDKSFFFNPTVLKTMKRNTTIAW